LMARLFRNSEAGADAVARESKERATAQQKVTDKVLCLVGGVDLDKLSRPALLRIAPLIKRPLDLGPDKDLPKHALLTNVGKFLLHVGEKPQLERDSAGDIATWEAELKADAEGRESLKATILARILAELGDLTLDDCDVDLRKYAGYLNLKQFKVPKQALKVGIATSLV